MQRFCSRRTILCTPWMLSLRPDGERIRVVRATVRNTAADVKGRQGGSMQISGDLALRDLKLGGFNLSGTGSLLVVKESTRAIRALRVRQPLCRDWIRRAAVHGGSGGFAPEGDLLVRNSTLIFPPTRTADVRTRGGEYAVPIAVVDDTTVVRGSGLRRRAAEYFGAESAGDAGGRHRGGTPGQPHGRPPVRSRH